MKSRLDLVPWDTIAWSDAVTADLLIKAAIGWWTRKIDDLPCVLPRVSIDQVGAVLAFGAAKYSARGWENDAKYHTASGHFDSMMRHALQTPTLDAESGLPHVAHALCRFTMLTTLLARGTLIDDRPPRVVTNKTRLDDMNELAFVRGGDS
jgi:hypothetical protein